MLAHPVCPLTKHKRCALLVAIRGLKFRGCVVAGGRNAVWCIGGDSIGQRWWNQHAETPKVVPEFRNDYQYGKTNGRLHLVTLSLNASTMQAINTSNGECRETNGGQRHGRKLPAATPEICGHSRRKGRRADCGWVWSGAGPQPFGDWSTPAHRALGGRSSEQQKGKTQG